MAAHSGTFPREISERRHVQGRTVRRIAVGVLSLFVLVGAAGYLGVHTTTASGSSSSDYFMTVDYGLISRPGLNTPLRIHVSKGNGFEGPLTIGITQAYMSLFDLNGFYPDPSSSKVSNHTLLYEFEEPVGDEFNFTLDARLGPSVQKGKRAHISVIEGGVEVNSVDIHTWVVP